MFAYSSDRDLIVVEKKVHSFHILGELQVAWLKYPHLPTYQCILDVYYVFYLRLKRV